MKSKVYITVRSVGTHFATQASVRMFADDREVFETRLFPFGFGTQAREAAAEWALRNNCAIMPFPPKAVPGKSMTAKEVETVLSLAVVKDGK